ncbi:SDR family oxidoreductase [Polaribacter sargassicola]|uniref:SDR family oxidoreductase n=1 Tax=Polaribacter sargassicola TaxID=2836891 RepID=UPI001F2EAE49|nr:SDR family oxidoreductase [Polaribacter sp. DS7-9]MCG1037057.1 SDR family oxidoreductase [Polaribacter sp. DS7-9]
MGNLKGKIAIITGSSRGIGAEIAKDLAKNGATIVINYTSSKESADKIVKEIINNGYKAISIKADISQKKDVIRLFDETINHFGKVDILVNNAGVMHNTLIKNTTDDLFEKQININLKGVFYTLREASTKLADCGSIINLSSSVTRTIFPTYGIYSATKIAIEQMSKVFAKEVGYRGINVNCILPGPTSTELFLKGKSEELITQLANNNAFNRLGTPNDIAKIVTFLASDEAKWISAQNIGANGAMV